MKKRMEGKTMERFFSLLRDQRQADTWKAQFLLALNGLVDYRSKKKLSNTPIRSNIDLDI